MTPQSVSRSGSELGLDRKGLSARPRIAVGVSGAHPGERRGRARKALRNERMGVSF